MSSLQEYIKSNPARPMRAWADDFGVSRPFLYGLLDGTRNPSLQAARRIEAATGGNVPITEWPNIRAMLDAAREATS